MDYKALVKALKFIFLPTLAVLLFIWFATLSLTGVLSFIVSDSGWAIAVRILLLLIEGALVWWMYDKYRIEHMLESTDTLPKDKWIKAPPSSPLKYLFDEFDYSLHYLESRVIDSDTIVIQRNFK